MRSSQTHGDEWPAGSAVFQWTCSFGPNFVGNVRPGRPMPCPPGPRNCGQRAAPSLVSPATTREPANENTSANDSTGRTFIDSLTFFHQTAPCEILQRVNLSSRRDDVNRVPGVMLL